MWGYTRSCNTVLKADLFFSGLATAARPPLAGWHEGGQPGRQFGAPAGDGLWIEAGNESQRAITRTVGA